MNSQPFGRLAFFPIACRRRFTSFVLSKRPSTLTVIKCIRSSFSLVAHEMVTLYFASGVNNGKRSTFNVKLCTSYNFYKIDRKIVFCFKFQEEKKLLLFKIFIRKKQLLLFVRDIFASNVQLLIIHHELIA